MNVQEFQNIIKQGIPSELPSPKAYPAGANRAPKRKDILSIEEKQLQALNNSMIFLHTLFKKKTLSEKKSFCYQIKNNDR